MLFCFCLMHINWGHSLRTAKIIRVTYWGSCAPASSVLVCVCVCVCVCARARMYMPVCVFAWRSQGNRPAFQDLLTLVSAPTLKESHTSERIVVSPGRSARTSCGSERLLSETGNHHHLHRALRFLRFGQCDQEEATIRRLQSPSHNLALNSCINGPDAYIQHKHSMLGHFTMDGDEGHAAQRAPSLNISESWKFRFTKSQSALGQGHPTL